MGCVYSSLNSRENTRQVFSVWNVDENGVKTNHGLIEISREELVLHQKGRNSVFWNLRQIRRYGFDSQLFSFECGRRCPTGAGIFAFKCLNAEQLFNALQEAIHETTTIQQNTNTTPPTEPRERFPLRHNTLESQTRDLPLNHCYVNSPFYVNTCAPLETRNANYAKLSDLVTQYVNVKTAREPVNYITLDLSLGEGSASGPTVVTTAPPTPVSKTPTMDLSLPSTPLMPMSYATIDFEKTSALSLTQRQNS